MADTAARITSFAPQLLVDDLDRAIGFYRDVLGFSFGPPWGASMRLANGTVLRCT